MADVSITRELGPAKGRYVAKFPDFDGEAELTFVVLDDDRVLADHTLTPVALRGRGVAGAVNGDVAAFAMRAEMKPYILLAEKMGALMTQLGPGAECPRGIGQCDSELSTLARDETA